MRVPSDFDGIPAYGELTPSEELHWHKEWQWYWLRYVEQDMKTLLVRGSHAFVNANWPLMSAEYKAAVWALMNDEERKRIREVRSRA